MDTTLIPITVYAESTPNPATMKFVLNKMLLAEGLVADYQNAAQAKGSPLALALFQLPFVNAVFISYNYISISKSDKVSWEDVLHDLRNYIRDYLAAGGQVINFMPATPKEAEDSGNFVAEVLAKTDIEKKIIAVLDEYVKPAVEQDGGLISFRRFENGVVTVTLRGSCSGCPSASITLKSGIEALLKRMVPGVETVVAEELQ